MKRPGAGSRLDESGGDPAFFSTFALLAGAAFLGGCAGGAPLLHPAHVLNAGDTSLGAGLSGRIPLERLSPTTGTGAANLGTLQELAVGPGVAPWVSGRMGLAGSNEGGLTYTGRALRVDARHAFDLRGAALSVGLGASVLAAQRPGDGVDGSSVYGGGFDVPVLLGVRSSSDLYALWGGPRAGFEVLSGRVAGTDPGTLTDVSARHGFVGFVFGLRAGFRHVHVALELDGAWHHVDAQFHGISTGMDQLSLTPSGALLLSF